METLYLILMEFKYFFLYKNCLKLFSFFIEIIRAQMIANVMVVFLFHVIIKGICRAP